MLLESRGDFSRNESDHTHTDGWALKSPLGFAEVLLNLVCDRCPILGMSASFAAFPGTPGPFDLLFCA